MNSKDTRNNSTKSFQSLLEIVDTLRKKCPWDQSQTLESLRELTIEECYELSDAILASDDENIIEEIGDILLHVLFYSKIMEEKNGRGIEKVIEVLRKKLIRRHPHIYGNERAETVKDVSKNWEKIKLKEKTGNSILSGVPKSAPPIKKSLIIQKKVATIGFDFENEHRAWEKIEEEIQELKKEKNKQDVENELGDVLFSLINWARKKGLDPHKALNHTAEKFTKRFSFIETECLKNQKSLIETSPKEMDRLWEISKTKPL